MSRSLLARVVLAVALAVGAMFIYPKLARHTARFVVRATPCVEAVHIEVWKRGEKARSLRVAARPSGEPAVYETSLRPGVYEVVVRLDCVSGAVRDGEPRPIVFSDEATFHLRAPGRCGCDPNTDAGEQARVTAH